MVWTPRDKELDADIRDQLGNWARSRVYASHPNAFDVEVLGLSFDFTIHTRTRAKAFDEWSKRFEVTGAYKSKEFRVLLASLVAADRARRAQ